MAESVEHVDVLIVGAGLSGIGAACQITEHLPHKQVAVLESREVSGGTWDLFKYPGIRSDSDMFTFGFHWRPWPSDTALADGPLILDYLRTVAEEYGVDKLIRYRHRVLGAAWDSETAIWTVEVDHAGERRQITTNLLWGCSGYYDYERGHEPDFPGAEDFAGEIIHPQHWPEDLDYAGKKVVVIGSGATAVTLVPAMGGTAAHVTMLQRSPSYVLSRAGRDPVARLLTRLPTRVSYPGGSLVQHPAGDRLLHAGPAAAGPGQEGAAQRHRQAAARRLRRRPPLQPDVQPVGPAPLLRAERRPVPVDPARARRRWSPTPSRPSRRPASGSPPARSSRPTSSSPPPA